jgi:hypothetical protein
VAAVTFHFPTFHRFAENCRSRFRIEHFSRVSPMIPDFSCGPPVRRNSTSQLTLAVRLASLFSPFC